MEVCVCEKEIWRMSKSSRDFTGLCTCLSACSCVAADMPMAPSGGGGVHIGACVCICVYGCHAIMSLLCVKLYEFVMSRFAVEAYKRDGFNAMETKTPAKNDRNKKKKENGRTKTMMNKTQDKIN